MPPKGPPKVIPSVDYVVEAELRERNFQKEIERKQAEQESRNSLVSNEFQKLRHVQDDHEQVMVDTQDVITDITREFKVNQNLYCQKIESLQEELTGLRVQVEDVQMKIRYTSEKFDRQRHIKDQQIEKNAARAEQMAQEFRDMLKGTLVKMSERIEITRDEDEKLTEPLSISDRNENKHSQTNSTTNSSV